MIDLTGKTFYIAGVANKKSVAYFTAKSLMSAGASCVFSAQNQQNLEKVNKLFPDSKSFILDVENSAHVADLAQNIGVELDGFLHSMAFANFSEGPKPFHETKLEDYLQACHISSFSLVQMSNAIKDLLKPQASVVTISISNTLATSYGYLGPIKAMLETTCAYLAKSFSEFSSVRFNSVGAGPLKTSASAGIPNYIENYLYSEELTLRKKNLETQEVANAALFLLSPISSGINATNMLVDAGMQANYFDQKIVKGFSKL
ncbi:MAG: SDR family oxidoreductase [Bacteriovoracaceae bacterium]|nr:SDR family oxidoreductase [Bacteriovoracaceae bacterium]